MWTCWIPVVQDLNQPPRCRLLLICLLLSHPWPCQPASLHQLQVCVCASVCSVYPCVSVWGLTLLFSAPNEQQQQPMEGSVPDASGENTEQTSATVPQVQRAILAAVWAFFMVTWLIVEKSFGSSQQRWVVTSHVYLRTVFGCSSQLNVWWETLENTCLYLSFSTVNIVYLFDLLILLCTILFIWLFIY